MIRCSHPDADFKTSGKASAIIPSNGVIYWHIANFTPDMDKYKVILAFEKAFNAWAASFKPLKFESTSDRSKAPIVINFLKNGDPGLPSPFSANTLAYAYFPSGKSLGIHSDMYFNEAVQWAEMHSAGNINLWKVVVHELGHAFGIHHSSDIKDIMYPTYQPNDEVNITVDTQNAIDYLYEQYRGPREVDNIDIKEFLKDLFPGIRRLRRLTKGQLKEILDVLSVAYIPELTKKQLVDAVNRELHGEAPAKFSVTGWIQNKILARVVGLLVRRGLDFITGALLASTVPVFIKLGNWILVNNLQLEAAIVSGVLALISILWSYLQKKADVRELEELRR